MSNFAAEMRIWRSRAAHEQFVKEIDDWRDARLRSDSFVSTVNAVHEELFATATKLSVYLGGESRTVADAYDRCARFDTALAWLRRVFVFFREKLDQRENDSSGDALRAADEVVWSSMRACAAARNEPVPIAYLDAQYSPASIRRDKSLAAVVDRGSGFEFLREYLKTLPIPVLRLPLSVIDAPWILVVLGHEVGHFLDSIVAPNYADTFAELVGKVAEDSGATADDVAMWKKCAPELFADWYSIGVMGPWALWAMAQFEIASDAVMRQRRTLAGYPSAIVRLEMMRQLADAWSPPGAALGSAVAATLGVPLTLPAAPAPEETRDRAVAAVLAQKLAAERIGAGGGMREVVGYDAKVFADNGEVDLWARALNGKIGKQPKKQPEEARQIAAAAARAASEAKPATDEQRSAFTKKLADATFAKIKASAPEGRRGPAEPRVEIVDAGERLSSLLLGLPRPEEMPT